MARTLDDLVWRIRQTHGEEAMQGFQVVGILEQGAAWQIFRLEQHNYVSVIHRHKSLRVPMQMEEMDDYLDVPECSMRVR